MSFSDKKAAENITLGKDFVRLLKPGETVVGAAVSISVLRGVDASPASMLSGIPVVTGSIVEQRVIGGLPGVYYQLEYTATTSLGHVLIERESLKVIA